MSKLIPVVLDDGASQIKLVYKKGNKLVKQITPSTVELRIQSNNLEFSKDSFVTDEGKPITVTTNNHAPQINSNPDLYQFSDANLAAVQKALMDAGFGGKAVIIGVSLPIGQFHDDDDELSAYNKKLVDAKKDNLMRKITPKNPNRVPAEIFDVAVSPEGLGAISELLYDENDELKYPGGSDRYVTIDIGDSTTDIAKFYSDGTREGSDSLLHGVNHCRRALKPLVSKKFDFEAGYGVLQNILKDKVFNGEDASGIANAAAEKVFDRMFAEVDDFIGNAKSYNKIFIIGGGANVFGELFTRKFGDRVVIPEDPEFTLAVSIFSELTELLENGGIGHPQKEVANG